jgi:hypothetical protein
MIFLSILTGCNNLFSPENISGTWIEADYNFSSNNSNDLCSTDDIIPNDSAFEYQFSTPSESNETDTGFRNSNDIDILASIELGRSNLWDICEYDDGYPQFDCHLPLLTLHFDSWKEGLGPFYTQSTGDSPLCEFKIDYGWTEGMFVNEDSLILSGPLHFSCIDSISNQYDEDNYCEFNYSSRLVKQ